MNPQIKAIVLAAGFGTRLRPLTDKHAKPALPVMGIPGVWYGIWQILKQTQEADFAVNVCHAPETIRDCLNDPDFKNILQRPIHVSDETDGILGSSGALKKLQKWMGKSAVLVTNGDSISTHSWSKMLMAHQSSGAKLTIHTRDFQSNDEQYADITLNAAKSLVTSLGQKKSSGIMFSGNYIIDSSLMTRLPEGASELRPALLEPLAREGALHAYHENCSWFDMGNVTTFASAQFEIMKLEPLFESLFKIKMKKISDGVWISKSLDPEKIKTTSPAIIVDDNKVSENKSVIGPNAVVIHPTQIQGDMSNILCFEEKRLKL